jgi:hypothetical protein
MLDRHQIEQGDLLICMTFERLRICQDGHSHGKLLYAVKAKTVQMAIEALCPDQDRGVLYFVF